MTNAIVQVRSGSPAAGCAVQNVAGHRHASTAALLLLGGMVNMPVFAADQSSTIRDLKQLNVEDLMSIEVTSVARHAEKLLGAASAIQVITQSEIRRSGAATLPEALRLASNLQVAQRGAYGWAISSRGFNTDLANKLLVMIDGRTVYTPLFSGVYWEVQDYLLEDIDRIEVISGPGGTLWGANAVNGVINIITRSAAETLGLQAEAGAGSLWNKFAGVRFGASASADTSFRVYGKYLDHDNSVLANGSSASDNWHKGQGGFRIDSTDSAGNLRTLQGDTYQLREHEASGVTTMRGANLLGRWTRVMSDKSDLALQAYYDWTKLADTVPALVLGGTQFAQWADCGMTFARSTWIFSIDSRWAARKALSGDWGFAIRTMWCPTLLASLSFRRSWITRCTAHSCRTNSGCGMTFRSHWEQSWNTMITRAWR